MTSEIVILITELRNKQRITLPAGAYRFGRSAQCEYVLRRNSVGDHQFTVSYEKDGWVVTDGASDYRTWYNNRYLGPGETSVLQAGDVIGLNTDGNSDTQEITFRVEEITNVQGDGAAPIKEQTTEAVLREVDIRRKKRVLIGRGDDCDIKLVSDRVSRHHCEVCTRTATMSCTTSAPPTAPIWTGCGSAVPCCAMGQSSMCLRRFLPLQAGCCTTTPTRAASVSNL